MASASLILWIVLLSGAPLVIGSLSQIVLAAVFESLVGQYWKRLPSSVFDFAAGIVSVVFAGVLAIWITGAISVAVPVVIAIYTTVWLAARGELRAIAPHVAGIALAYLFWFR